MKKVLPLLLIAVYQLAFGQTDSSKGSVTFSGYAEVYYCYDFNQPGNHELPSFLYSCKRHNEVNLSLGFDFGMEQKSKGSHDYNTLFIPVLILRYQLKEKAAIATRGEFYSGKNEIIIYTGPDNGFQTQSYSVNFDSVPFKNVLSRIKARTYKSKDDVFTKEDGAKNMDTFAITSLSISL